MGRVSKHKKIKAIDPFYKGPRRDQSREENLPPTLLTDDQPIPKSLLRIVHSSQPRKKSHSRKSRDKASSHRELTTPPKEHTEDDGSFSRREGESLTDFLDRIEVESRARLVELSKKSKGTSERRKKYYEKRKRRLESKKGRKQEPEEVVEFTDLKDTVRFGEVVSAPPRLSAKPRRKATTTTASKLPPSSDEPERAPAVVGLKRKHDIEEERERLIAEYRLCKKAKRERTRQLTL